MKGLVHTSVFMSAVLDKQNGLKRNRRLSQITVFRNTTLGDVGLTFLTDCAINIEMTLQVKKDIIENAVLAARAFGIECPKVALLGAVETVNEAMSDTLNSAILTQMNRRGQLTGCIVDGPLSLDNAISKEAAQRKGIVSDVAGEADILVGSCLQEANSLSKGLNFYAQFSTASIIVGTEQPIIMTSRTDQQENKLNSIAATCYYQRHVGGAKA
jgi:phosphate butyryltransferase